LQLKKTINSVVHVKNTSISSGSSSVWDYFNNNQSNRTRVGMGSGVIISKDGYIITNNHVIENATTIEITTNNNKSYQADLIGSDEVADIAVLKIDSNEIFPYIRFANSDQTKIGEWVLAVGNPFNLTSTVTAGIISAKSRDLNDYDSKNQSFIQTDAAVNSGNSGGALVNTSGDLIGINTAITSGTGGFVGYSFAVPSNVARKIFEDIIEFGNVQKGLLGVTGFGLNSRNADELNISLTEGFYVNDVEPSMGAASAGIKKGDVILSLDKLEIAKFSDLSGYLSTKRPGDVILVGIIRNNSEMKLKVVLEKK
jgi:S1-C subfamily serine protease